MIVLILILAVIQGAGEFLPISSSGHLLVAGWLFSGENPALSDEQVFQLGILLHAGTLMAILVVFARDIWEILTRRRRWLLLLLIGTIPGALAGLIIKYNFVYLEGSLEITAVGFLATAFLLDFVLGRASRTQKELQQKQSKKDGTNLTFFSWNSPHETGSPEENSSAISGRKDPTVLQALFVGLFQAIAVLPGFSRSGFTIMAGILGGLDRRTAAVFSFLLSIPIIGGALLLEALEFVVKGKYAMEAEVRFLLPAFVAMFVSFLVGLVSLRLLIKWLRNGSLHYWAIWLVLMALVAALASIG